MASSWPFDYVSWISHPVDGVLGEKESSLYMPLANTRQVCYVKQSESLDTFVSRKAPVAGSLDYHLRRKSTCCLPRSVLTLCLILDTQLALYHPLRLPSPQ